MMVQAGSSVTLTESQFTSPGSILLVASSVEELDDDLTQIERLEEEGLFVLV